MTHGEADWCVRRRYGDGICDYLCNAGDIGPLGGKWGMWIFRDRLQSRSKAMVVKWQLHDTLPSGTTLHVIRVTHRRKGT